MRGVDTEWLREAYEFALKPGAILHLCVNIGDLVTRVLQSGGFDYWESGMGLRTGEELNESFIRYQKWLLAEFDKRVEPYDFDIIDAARSVEEVFQDLRVRVDGVIGSNGIQTFNDTSSLGRRHWPKRRCANNP